MTDQHSPPIKSTKQLITLVVLAFVVPVLIIVLLVVYVTGAKRVGVGADAMTPERIADRLRPVGTVVLGAPAQAARAAAEVPPPAAAPVQAVVVVPPPVAVAPVAVKVDVGEALYKRACSACHVAAVAGAPRSGDRAAWAPRIKLGIDALTASVVKGKGAMPPMGGAVGASEAEIRAAVEHMVAQAR